MDRRRRTRSSRTSRITCCIRATAIGAGRPDKARSWYQHLVEALTLQDWQTAVYCAGVLSHYYTDPLHPFHTHQSEAENNIHRAVEWSISKAYDELYALGKGQFDKIDVEIAREANWLEQLVCQGAEMSNGYYEKLIAHYDIQRGMSDPPAGLDQVAKRIVSRLIWYASISFGAVLDRAIDESNMHPPETPLLPATLLATIQVPIKVLAKRMADVEERRQVERMYDELITTGTVEKTLPEDDRAVRDLHAAEVLAKLPPKPEASKVFPFVPARAGCHPHRSGRAATGAGPGRPSCSCVRGPPCSQLGTGRGTGASPGGARRRDTVCPPGGGLRGRAHGARQAAG